MKNNRTIVKGTALLLTLSLAACGGAGTSGTGATEKPQPGAEKPPESNNPSFIANLTLKTVRSENSTTPLKPNTPVLREIEQKTGIKLAVEAVPSSNYSEKKKVLIGTNNMPDLMMVKQADINDFARTGVFLDLTPYIDQHAPNLKKALQELPEYSRLLVDGKLYGFPLMKYTPTAWDIGKAPAIRTDLLKKHHLPVPQSFDELYTVLKKLKEAYPDSSPFTTRAIEGSLDAIAYAFGTGFKLYFEHSIDKGTYKYGNITPEFKSMLEYLHKLYAEGLLDPNFAVNNNQKWLEAVGSNKAFFVYDNMIFVPGMNSTLRKGDPGATMEIIPFLRNPQGQARAFTYAKDWPDDSWAVSSKVKDPVAVVKLYDWLYSEEGMLASNYGILGETYEMVDGKPQFLKSFLEKLKVNDATGINTLYSELGSGYNAYSPLVDRFGPEVQVMDEATKQLYKQYAEDPAVKNTPRQINVTPPLTKDQQDQVKQIQSKLDPVVMDAVIKFIMGVKPLSEFDSYKADLIEKGALQLEEIYNAALANTR